MKSAVMLAMILTVATGWTQQSSPADAPSSKEDIQRLFGALHIRERAELIRENSQNQARKMANEIVEKGLSEASQAERAPVQAMIDEMVDGVEKAYPVDAMLQDMIPIYQRHLTKDDCNELIAFYSSPVGQKILRELPAITSESMQVSNAHLQPMYEAAIDRLKENLKRMDEENRKKNVGAKDKNATKN